MEDGGLLGFGPHHWADVDSFKISLFLMNQGMWSEWQRVRMKIFSISLNRDGGTLPQTGSAKVSWLLTTALNSRSWFDPTLSNSWKMVPIGCTPLMLWVWSFEFICSKIGSCRRPPQGFWPNFSRQPACHWPEVPPHFFPSRKWTPFF